MHQDGVVGPPGLRQAQAGLRLLAELSRQQHEQHGRHHGFTPDPLGLPFPRRFSISSSVFPFVSGTRASPTRRGRVKVKKEQALRRELAKTRQDPEAARKHLGAVVEDLGRIRANIKELPSSSRAYKRLVDKIDEQEPQLEKLQADIKRPLALQNSQQKVVDDFLAGFTAEEPPSLPSLGRVREGTYGALRFERAVGRERFLQGGTIQERAQE
jgi:hypothetical protein